MIGDGLSLPHGVRCESGGRFPAASATCSRSRRTEPRDRSRPRPLRVSAAGRQSRRAPGALVQARGEVVSPIVIPPRYQGPKGAAQGGIVATYLDEVLGAAVLRATGRPAV